MTDATNSIELVKTFAALGMTEGDLRSYLGGRQLTDAEVSLFRQLRSRRKLRDAVERERRRKEREEEAAASELPLSAPPGAPAATDAQVSAHLAGTAWPDHFPKRGPMSATERTHRFRARAREIGDIPAPQDPERRARCRDSLLAFGREYCLGGGLMLRREPAPRMVGFVDALQETITHGGNRHVRWPRGKGKSTWLKVAALWALVYGWRRFVVIISATKPMAEEITGELWRFVGESELFAADFPEFALPVRDVALTPQRSRIQTYRGKLTHILDNIRYAYKRFASLDGYENTGGIIAARGADQAIRGLNIGSVRPDFIFIDDPQTDESARSRDQVDKIEQRIQSALLGLGDTDRTIAAVMASTPIEPDDISERYADPDRHGEWLTTTERLVVEWGPEAWAQRYLEEIRLDNALGDVLLTRSRRFYKLHRAEIERGTEVMDPGDFDPELEVSAYQHALNRLHVMKRKAFDSECQMRPTRSQGVFQLHAGKVAAAVNHTPYGVVPPQCDQGIVCFCDVNAIAGLRWEIMAFGAGRVTATLAYGKFPERGRLYPEGTPESAIPNYLAPAMRAVFDAVRSVTFRAPGADGAAPTERRVEAICFDGGWQTETVAVVCRELDTREFPVCWSRGYDTRNYSRYHEEKAAVTAGLKAGEYCHLWQTAHGTYLAFCADYWREVSQSSYLAAPLTPSSSSFWGDDSTLHYDFAAEVCAEELVGKERSSRYGYVWTWKKRGDNHFGDAHYGCMVFGAIRGNFDAVSKLAATLPPGNQPKRRKRYVWKRKG